MVSKVRNVRLGVFSGGGCHHPNTFFIQSSLRNVTTTNLKISTTSVSSTIALISGSLAAEQSLTSILTIPLTLIDRSNV